MHIYIHIYAYVHIYTYILYLCMLYKYGDNTRRYLYCDANHFVIIKNPQDCQYFIRVRSLSSTWCCVCASVLKIILYF